MPKKKEPLLLSDPGEKKSLVYSDSKEEARRLVRRNLCAAREALYAYYRSKGETEICDSDHMALSYVLCDLLHWYYGRQPPGTETDFPLRSITRGIELFFDGRKDAQ